MKTLILAASAATLLGLGGFAIAQHAGHGQPARPAQGAPAQMQHGQGHHGMHGQAQSPSGGHAGHGAAAPAGDNSPSSAAFRAANEKMHKDMTVPLTGDADVDFVRGMIPHHQGAVDMARIVLAFGKDPELKKLAQEIVDAQEKEMTFMREWLKKNGK